MKTRFLSSLVIVFLLSLSGLSAQDTATDVLEKPEGMLIDRDSETQLQVNMESGRLVVRVLDMDYQALPGIFVKGYGEVDANGKKRQKVVMRPNAEGDGLKNLKFIPRPNVFNVRLILFTSDDDSSKEVYNFQYNEFSIAKDAEK